MAFSTLFTTPLSAFVALGGLTALFVPWLVRLPRLTIGLLFLSLLAGQLIRLPLPGQGGGLLLSDIAAVAILLSTFLQLLSRSVKQTPLTRQLLIITAPFILWSLFTLLIKISSLGPANTLIAASYWLRLTVLFLLLPALTILFQNFALRQYAWNCLYLTIILLTILGVAQLILFPDLSPYSLAGWDPHQFRLVSTWIDPNFFGAFLAMGLMVFLFGPKLKAKQRILLVLITILALFATQSRSTIIALVISTLFTTPFFLSFFSKNISIKQLIFITSTLSLCVLITLLAVAILLPRFIGLISIDPTVQARVSSIQKALPIIKDNSLLGVGYNAYQFAKSDTGVASNFQNHSRAGADNSLLTIWATTGLVGLLLFLAPWILIIHKSFLRLHQLRSPLSLMSILCILVLFIHSQFVNSLIYSHLLITLIIIVSLTMTTQDHHSIKIPLHEQPQN